MTIDKAQPPPPEPANPPVTDRLDSWKGIAAYLKRDERTVRRWEKVEGLPVRRHLHDKRPTVYAYKAEIDAWWNNRRPRLEAQEAEEARRKRKQWVLHVAGVGAAVGLLVVLVGLNVAHMRDRLLGRPVAGEITSIAVLPLANISGDPEQEYFVDGMTDALINELGQISALRVISRQSAMRYKGTPKALAQIARELNVDALMEGSVMRSGERVQIRAQLIHAPTDRHLWARSYERDVRDVLSLQRDVAREIAHRIKLKLTPHEQARLTERSAINPEAYELYLKGRFLQDKWSTEENLKKAIEYFEQAIEKEPTYAAAHAGRALPLLLLAAALIEALPPLEVISKARLAAKKALELDETSPEAYEILGWIAHNHDWEWDAAERAYRRAIELNPNYAQPHMWLQQLLNVVGRHQEALALIRRARQLDPLSAHVLWSLAEGFIYVGAIEQAAEECQEAINLHPHFWPLQTLLGEIYVRQGKRDLAIARLEKGVELSQRHPHALVVLGSALALAGRRQEALKILAELRELSQRRYFSPAGMARLYASLGETEQAFASLEKAYEDRSSWMTRIRLWGPMLGNLPSNPGYQVLLRRMNFPE